MRDREHLIFGDPKLTQVRSAGQDEVVHLLILAVCSLQKTKVEQLGPAGKVGTPGGATHGGGRQAMRVLLRRGWKARGDGGWSPKRQSELASKSPCITSKSGDACPRSLLAIQTSTI